MRERQAVDREFASCMQAFDLCAAISVLFTTACSELANGYLLLWTCLLSAAKSTAGCCIVISTLALYCKASGISQLFIGT